MGEVPLRNLQPALFRNLSILSIPNCLVSGVVDNPPLPTFPLRFVFPVSGVTGQSSQEARRLEEPVIQISQGQVSGNIYDILIMKLSASSPPVALFHLGGRAV